MPSDDNDVDLGVEPTGPFVSLAQLETKYREQMRQIYPTKIDLPLFGLVEQIKEQIDLRPDFQRRDRWDNPKRSRFIESIIMNVPVPPVFLGEEQYGKYVVLDGRQRLTSLNRFLKGELTLEGLEVWDELNNLTFPEMKARGFGATVERRFLPAVLLTKESSPEVKYEVFDRLNTGGISASAMEVRNAVFPGKFNRLLHRLSELPTFRQLWGIPNVGSSAILEENVTYRTMADLELVLRFFALQEGSLSRYKFKDYLSVYMEKRNKLYEQNPEIQDKDEITFTNALENTLLALGPDAFRRPDQDEGRGKRRRSAPYADAILFTLARFQKAELIPQQVIERLKIAIQHLFANERFVQAISTGTNGEGAIRDRTSLMSQAFVAAIRH